MIYCYCGFPGSGKTLDAVDLIVSKLRAGCYVLTNIDLDFSMRRKPFRGRLTHVDISDLQRVDVVKNWAFENRRPKYKTFIVIDESQVVFDARFWDDAGRADWNIFFSQHRKYNSDIILITQSLENLDKRIRANVEIVRKHTNIANASKITRTLSLFMGNHIFIGNDYYAGYARGNNIGSHWILARRSLTRYYNSFQIVDDLAPDETEQGEKQHEINNAINRKITINRTDNRRSDARHS